MDSQLIRKRKGRRTRMREEDRKGVRETERKAGRKKEKVCENHLSERD